MSNRLLRYITMKLVFGPWADYIINATFHFPAVYGRQTEIDLEWNVDLSTRNRLLSLPVDLNW